VGSNQQHLLEGANAGVVGDIFGVGLWFEHRVM
jgi:hypothetical protein